MKDNRKELVKQLKDLIQKGNAHTPLDAALAHIAFRNLGTVPDRIPYSIWQVAEHIRICQWDILEFSRNPSHVSPKWPDECWPVENAPANEAAWDHCIAQIKSDRNEFIALLDDESLDLYTPFPYGDGQNLLREAMLIADHNSYHTGEIIVIRRLLGNWK